MVVVQRGRWIGVELDRDGADDVGGGPCWAEMTRPILPKPGGYAQMTQTQQRNWRLNLAKVQGGSTRKMTAVETLASKAKWFGCGGEIKTTGICPAISGTTQYSLC